MDKNPVVKRFTTDPTTMRNAGVSDYEAFAREILRAIPDRPISLEVFSDDFGEMETQALQIAPWGENVYVKIPVTHSQAFPARVAQLIVPNHTECASSRPFMGDCPAQSATTTGRRDVVSSLFDRTARCQFT